MTSIQAAPNGKSPFTLAKEVIHLATRFKLPLTPDVYGVLYRYVEGDDQELTLELDFAVNESGALDSDHVSALHLQYCVPHNDSNAKFGEQLANELAGLRSLVSDQEGAGIDFGRSILKVEHLLGNDSSSESDIKKGVLELAKRNAEMSGKLELAESKLRLSQKRIEKMQNELRESQRSMMLDPLTKIGNRRYFDTVCRKLIGDQGGVNAIVHLALFDLDNLKKINDINGHPAGDYVIQFVASQLSSRYPNLAIARLGGDEFAAFLSGGTRDDAVAFAEAVKDHFASQTLQVVATNEVIEGIFFSVGIAKLRSTDDPTSWYARADSLLYEAKRLGRNRAVVERSLSGAG